jgi:hypothetical protein
MESRMGEFVSEKQYRMSCLILTPGKCRADSPTSAQERIGRTKLSAEVRSQIKSVRHYHPQRNSISNQSPCPLFNKGGVGFVVRFSIGIFKDNKVLEWNLWRNWTWKRDYVSIVYQDRVLKTLLKSFLVRGEMQGGHTTKGGSRGYLDRGKKASNYVVRPKKVTNSVVCHHN